MYGTNSLSNQDRSNQKTPQVTNTELRPKMKLNGTVEQVEPFGAMVNIGADRPALLHISQMGGTPSEPAATKVRAGEEITVWVLKVNSKAARIDLTLIEPVAVDWDEIKPGQVRDGKVVRLEKFGAFVDIGAEREGLVHIKELTTGRVLHPSEIVSVGDKVEVQVTSVDRKKRRIGLSMRVLEVEPVEDTDESEPIVTTIAAALHAAMDAEKSKTKTQRRKRGTPSPRGSAREDIFRRTLNK